MNKALVMTKDTDRMSKEEMIDTLKGVVFDSFHRTTAKEREALNAVINALEKEPKTGHWIGDKCSECREERAWYGNNPPYCPDCGIKMVGPQESEE